MVKKHKQQQQQQQQQHQQKVKEEHVTCCGSCSYVQLCVIIVASVVGFVLSVQHSCAELYVSLLIAALLFAFGFKKTTSKRKKQELSAYAALNPQGYALPGSISAAQLDARYNASAENKTTQTFLLVPDEDDDGGGAAARKRVVVKRLSKHANKKCPCGSGKKTKHCCGRIVSASQRLREQQEAEVAFEQYEKDWLADE
jgi:hypothetical protein